MIRSACASSVASKLTTFIANCSGKKGVSDSDGDGFGSGSGLGSKGSARMTLENVPRPRFLVFM